MNQTLFSFLNPCDLKNDNTFTLFPCTFKAFQVHNELYSECTHNLTLSSAASMHYKLNREWETIHDVTDAKIMVFNL